MVVSGRIVIVGRTVGEVLNILEESYNIDSFVPSLGRVRTKWLLMVKILAGGSTYSLLECCGILVWFGQFKM